MAYWLLKTEPEELAWGDLVRSGVTRWTSVRNAQAQENLRAMQPGDRAVIYHSGEKLAWGIAEIVSAAYPDPTGDGGSVCVDVRALEPLPAPVPLEALKQEPAFAGSPLFGQARLSVVPISPAEWRDLAAVAEVIARTAGLRADDRF